MYIKITNTQKIIKHLKKTITSIQMNIKINTTKNLLLYNHFDCVVFEHFLFQFQSLTSMTVVEGKIEII